MAFTLYTRPGSGGFVVEAAFALAGVAADTIDVKKGIDDRPGSAFRTISPVGQVPALTLPDGRTMTESGAICLYLGELHPGALGPAPGTAARPDFLRWMVFMSSALYPALLRFFYAPRYTTDASGEPAVQGAATAEVDRHFAIIETALAGRKWLVGDTMTIADVYLLMVAHWHPVGDKPRAEWTNIVRVCGAVKGHPTIAAMNDRHKMW